MLTGTGYTVGGLWPLTGRSPGEIESKADELGCTMLKMLGETLCKLRGEWVVVSTHTPAKAANA